MKTEMLNLLRTMIDFLNLPTPKPVHIGDHYPKEIIISK